MFGDATAVFAVSRVKISLHKSSNSVDVKTGAQRKTQVLQALSGTRPVPVPEHAWARSGQRAKQSGHVSLVVSVGAARNET